MTRRLAAVLLAASAALGATAAPAPVYKPPTGVWGEGWGDPFAPDAGCRFDRRGGQLTVTLSRGHSRKPGLWKGRKDVPHILREVDGDFDVQVRITGEFDLSEGARRHESRREVGLMLEAGGTGCFSRWTTWVEGKLTQEFHASYLSSKEATHFGGGEIEPVGCRTYHRLSRRGDRVLLAVSLDGKEWEQLRHKDVGVLPRVVRVGVFACKVGPVPFRAILDDFKLTRP